MKARRFRKVRSFALVIALLAGMLGLAGCGEDSRAPAVQEAISSYLGENPQLYQIEIDELGRQLKAEVPGEAPYRFTLKAKAPDPSRVKAADLVGATGGLELAVGLDLADPVPGYNAMRLEAQAKLGDLVRAADDPPTTQVEIGLELKDAADGWQAEVTDEVAGADFDQKLVSDAITRTSQWSRLAAATLSSAWLDELFPGIEAGFKQNVIVESLEPSANGKYDEVTAVVKYPEVSAYYVAAAEAAYEEYASDKEPIFDSLSESEFADKMDQVAPRVTADQTTTVELKVTVRGTSALPVSVDDPLALREVVMSSSDVTVLSSSATLTGAESIKQQAIQPKLEKLNKEKVVKEQELPSSKVLQGTSSGTKINIISEGEPDLILTFKKSNKVVLKVMVRAKKTVTVRVPSGEYEIIMAAGDTYYGPKYTYGPTGTYRKTTMTVSVARSGNRVYYHDLTINKASGGTMTTTSAPYEY